MTKKGIILVSVIGGVLALGGIGVLIDKGSEDIGLPDNSGISISTISDLNRSESVVISSELKMSTSTEANPRPNVLFTTTPNESIETSASAPSATTPKEITYVLNTNSHKVHKPSCRDVDKIKSKNYLTTADLQGAINNGYTACGHCHPF